jgi:hypothetical protein
MLFLTKFIIAIYLTNLQLMKKQKKKLMLIIIELSSIMTLKQFSLFASILSFIFYIYKNAESRKEF